MLFNFSVVVGSSVEILFLSLTLHNHLTIHASCIPSQITSTFTSQVSFPYSISLDLHLEYYLHFASKGKPLLANKGTKSLPSIIDPCYDSVNITSSISYCVNKIKLFHSFKRLAIWFYVWINLLLACCWFEHVCHSNFLPSSSLHLIPPHLLCTQHLQNWHRMRLLPTPFLQIVQGNLPFIVISQVFSPLAIDFFSLTFIFISFDSIPSF